MATVPVSKSQKGYSRRGPWRPGFCAGAVTGIASTPDPVRPRSGMTVQCMAGVVVAFWKLFASMVTQPLVSMNPLNDSGGVGPSLFRVMGTVSRESPGPLIVIAPSRWPAGTLDQSTEIHQRCWREAGLSVVWTSIQGAPGVTIDETGVGRRLNTSMKWLWRS